MTTAKPKKESASGQASSSGARFSARLTRARPSHFSGLCRAGEGTAGHADALGMPSRPAAKAAMLTRRFRFSFRQAKLQRDISMRSRSALSVLGACWFAACSFPEYQVEEVDPLAQVCTDGRTSAAESGIDCGGGCPRCGMGQSCRNHQDCESLACGADGTCQVATCGDGVKNGAEADQDCGGLCDGCQPGRDCTKPEDCKERVCADGFCQVPTCSDQVPNGIESDLDCGSACPACGNGKRCLRDQDCISQQCDEGVCVDPGCTNDAKNDAETDVDCGGGECSPCQPTQACLVGSDCTSLICDENKQCTAYSCDDGVLNGDETALDCGGGACQGCRNLESCEEGRDCASGACQSSLCVPATPTGVVLPRDGFSAAASNTYPDDDPNEVLDSVGGRWTSGTRQYDGMWFEIDMGELHTFFNVVLTCDEQPDDVPAKFDLYLSIDGEYGAPARAGLFGKAVTDIQFDSAQVARYVKFVLRQETSRWLSINEINVVE